MEYMKWTTPEGKFVYQLDMVENLLEAFEHWKENKNFPTQPWWQHAEEVIDDPVLLEFLKEIEKEEKK
jgi:5'-deoxynucleotidase YfbR-like HD superfamily hydrolase